MSEPKLTRRDKADILIQWFEGRPLPKGPVQIDVATKILNFETAVNTAISQLQGSGDTHKQNFLACYHRLYNLKQYLLKNQ